MNLVEEAVHQWETYRAGVIAELELIPDDQWDHRPAEGARTVRALARHIMQAAVGFTNELLREDGSFTRLFDPVVQEELRRTLPPARNREEILEALRATGADNARRLREAGEALATRTMPSGKSTQSRLAGLTFATAHEMYHRGQVAMMARLLGHKPALTQQIEKLAR